jgi:hypothetical protein
MKTNLTPEQSATLIAKGISADKASKQGDKIFKPVALQNGSIKRVFDGYEPIFTLADLLSLLPKHIRIEHRHYYLRMNTFVLTDEANPMWIARYITSNSAITLHERWSEELIDALYKLLTSLLDNHVKLD